MRLTTIKKNETGKIFFKKVLRLVLKQATGIAFLISSGMDFKMSMRKAKRLCNRMTRKKHLLTDILPDLSPTARL